MNKLTLLILLCIIVCSCGYREGIIQKADKSYIQFTGNPANAQVQIDDMATFTIEANDNKLYEIPPGKHLIKIYKGSRLMVNKITYVQSQTTMEVEIP